VAPVPISNAQFPIPDSELPISTSAQLTAYKKKFGASQFANYTVCKLSAIFNFWPGLCLSPLLRQVALRKQQSPQEIILQFLCQFVAREKVDTCGSAADSALFPSDLA